MSRSVVSSGISGVQPAAAVSRILSNIGCGLIVLVFKQTTKLIVSFPKLVVKAGNIAGPIVGRFAHVVDQTQLNAQAAKEDSAYQ